jgi:hypothetical protein
MKLITAIFGVGLGVLTGTVLAAPTLDAHYDGTGAVFGAGNSRWESFTAINSGQITQMALGGWWTNPNNNYTLSIYEGGGISGAKIGYINPLNITAMTMYDKTLFNVTAMNTFVVAGLMYTWRLENATPFAMVGYPWAGYPAGSVDSSAYFQAGVSPSYYFQIYVDPSISPPSPAPIPATIALLGLGLVGLGATRRRQA